MTETLYPDQDLFFNNVRAGVMKHHHVIACAATGFGKTIVFTKIAEGALQNNRIVLVLTESKKIFNQISARIHATLINPKFKDIFLPAEGCYIAMAQTLQKRQQLIDQLKKFGKDLIVIVDEAHMAHFSKILFQLTEARIIGFTATPDARWAKHLPLIYKGIVVGPQPHELVQLGRLAPYKHFARVAADLSKLKIQSGDFTEESQEEAFGNAKVFEGVVDDLKKLQYKKCLIFCASIKDCNTLSENLNALGLKNVPVHTGLAEEDSMYNLARFSTFVGDDAVNICVSVGTLTKGYDFPEIDLVVLRRATTSLPLFLQMIGRASRKADGKLFFTVLDYGENYMRHGLWDWDRDWETYWNKPKYPKEGVAAIKVCPVCEYIVPVTKSTCPNCGYEFEKRDVPLKVGELIEITEMYSTKIVGKRMSQLEPLELSIYAKLKNKKNFAARVARAMEIKKPGYLMEFSKQMGYKEGWVDWQLKSIENGNIQFADFILK